MAKAKYKQLVNTEGISTAATKLRNVNENISGKFDTLTKKAKSLESDWNSAAGSLACSKMYELFKLDETRYSVIQNYINMLEQQIDPNYESAEETNTTLADQFK